MGRVEEKGDVIQQCESPQKMTDELLNCLERGRALWTVVILWLFLSHVYLLCGVLDGQHCYRDWIFRINSSWQSP